MRSSIFTSGFHLVRVAVTEAPRGFHIITHGEQFLSTLLKFWFQGDNISFNQGFFKVFEGLDSGP